MRSRVPQTVAALLFAMTISSCTLRETTNPKAKWQVYRAEDGFFTVEYPPGWKYQKFDGSDLGANSPFTADELQGVTFGSGGIGARGALFLLVSDSQFEPLELRLGISVVNDKLADSAKEMADLAVEASRSYEGFELVDSGPLTIDGQEGYSVTINATGHPKDGPPRKQTERVVILISGGKTIMLNAGAFADTFVDQHATIDRFVRSIRFEGS